MDAANDKEIYELMLGIRKLTRTTLMHQHHVAQLAGLNASDAECLDFLKEMGPSTAGELSRVTGLTTGAVTFVIDRLAKAGFVQRSADAADRRKVIVSILPGKQQDVAEQYKLLAKDVKKLLSGYKKPRLKMLLQFTAELTDVYKRRIG